MDVLVGFPFFLLAREKRNSSMSDTGTIIPVRIRTARTRHPCAGIGERCGGIRPGEQYEDWRLPPQRDVNTGDHWWVLKVHFPSRPESGPSGCEVAAAYRDQAARSAGAVA